MVRARGLVVLTLAVFVAFACGGTSGGTGSNKGTISIGVDLPESGAAASGGLSTLNGVKFAVQQAGSLSGWTLTVENRDDAVQGAYNEAKGVQNVQDLIANSHVVSMIGPYNSAVAKAEIPITNPVGLTMISPSNTNPCLTKDIAGCSYHPQDLRKGKPNNYFRVVATDDLQGPAAATYLYNTLNVHTLGVLDEKTVFGVGIADAMQAKFKALGGTAIRDSYDPATTVDWRNFLNKFKAAGATGLYVGGTDDKKACQPRHQFAQVGIGSWPYVGGDGIETTQCIDDAQAGAIGLTATTAGADAGQIPAAASTITAFKQAFTGANDYGAYTMSAYDATNIEIAAIKKALADGKDPNKLADFREAVRANVAATTNYAGVLGSTTFDANGDTSAKIISIYSVKDVGAARAAQGDLTCGSKPSDKTLCYVWVTQFDFAKS
jgi:branched-chain amino acid transport system substrate-binding protein